MLAIRGRNHLHVWVDGKMETFPSPPEGILVAKDWVLEHGRSLLAENLQEIRWYFNKASAYYSTHRGLGPRTHKQETWCFSHGIASGGGEGFSLERTGNSRFNFGAHHGSGNGKGDGTGNGAGYYDVHAGGCLSERAPKEWNEEELRKVRIPSSCNLLETNNG